VLGDAFTVDGQEFVPADTASYDAVGFAALDMSGGEGMTLAHKTLPMPSYVEVTDLETGRTILARVERRGPMTANRLVALSPGAQALLGAVDGAPVRVRRVNPPETDRVELRAGRKAADRMDTPKSLLGVLQRKLPGAANSPAPVRVAQAAPAPAAPVARPVPTEPPAARASAPANSVALGERTANTAYPLGGAPRVAPARPAEVARTAQPKPAPAPAPTTAAKGDFVVQAAAFANKANADRAAGKLGGFVTKSGTLYRVRTGPYASRGQAEAALAKVREAGYSDARVFTAG
jgi:rare lipoprotein A